MVDYIKKFNSKIPRLFSKTSDTHLVVLNPLLCLPVIGSQLPIRYAGQIFHQIAILHEVHLLGNARYLVINRFAGQRIHHLYLTITNRPIDAEIRCFSLIPRLSRCDQCQAWLIQVIGWRKTLYGFLYSAAYGTIHMLGMQ